MVEPVTQKDTLPPPWGIFNIGENEYLISCSVTVSLGMIRNDLFQSKCHSHACWLRLCPQDSDLTQTFPEHLM